MVLPSTRGGHIPSDEDDGEHSSSSSTGLLLPESDFRFGSVEPTPTPVPGTPRRPGITADNITPKHPEYHKRLDEAMKPRYTQVTTTTFLNEFLQGKNLTTPQLRKIGTLKDYDVTGCEHNMYAPLCRLFNAVVKVAGADSDAVFKDVAHWIETGDTDHRPDIVLYPTNTQAMAAYRLTEAKVSKSEVAKSRKPFMARCAYAWMVTAMEIKREGVETGFSFKPGEPLVNENDKAVVARSQFATYAAEIMLRQHRTHLFMFYISGWWVRVFRWDRNGAIISHPIDLRTESKVVLNIIYRLVKSKRSAQGFDDTVTLASDADINKLRAYNPSNVYLNQYKKDILNGKDFDPIYKVGCDEVLQDDDSRRTRLTKKKTFLIGRHASGGYAPIGRGTRGWFAYNLDDEVMMFMKEQWRPNAFGVNPEIQTYLRLRKHDVECVATAFAGGDVSGLVTNSLHKTVSQRFLDKEGLDLPERIHTRIVLKEVGRPLETYSDSIDLMAVTSQALTGHQQAWEKAGILHRDVSVANILIDLNTSRGFLSDWDLCKYKEQLDVQTGLSQPDVSGTLAFGSALSLMYPLKPKELADDLESFVHVPVYCLFRYHKHDYSSPEADMLKNAGREKQTKANHENRRIASRKHDYFYEDSHHGNGLYSGGDMKFTKIQAGTPPIKLTEQESPAAKLLQKLFSLLQDHYKTINFEDLQHYLAEPARPSKSSPKPIHGDEERQEFVDPWDGLNVDPMIYSDSSSTPSASTSGSVYDQVRPLDDHAMIMKIFRLAWTDKRGRALNMGCYRNDKLYDQFDGNVVITSEDIRLPSPESNRDKPEEATKNSKRKSFDDTGLDPAPEPKRRFKRAPVKRTPWHGIKVELSSIPSADGN